METPKAHFDFLQGVQELSTNDSVGSPIAGSATFSGHVYDCGNLTGPLPGVNPPPSAGIAGPAYFRAFASSDQTGTLNVQQSPDNSNWFVTDTVAITADFTKGKYLESPVLMRYVRAQIVNGSTLQVHVELDTALVSR